MPNEKLRAWLNSPEGKTKMAQFREETAAIEEYLAWLASTASKGAGRRRTVESIGRQIDALDVLLADTASTTWVQRVLLVQKRADLSADLAVFEESFDLEVKFIKVVAPFSERKGIDYATWRAMGVPARVLREGGVVVPRQALGGARGGMKKAAPKKRAASKPKARTTKKESEK